MRRATTAVISVLVALTLCAPDAEARGGRRGGGGGKSRSSYTSAPKSTAANTAKKTRKARSSPVNVHVHLPATKPARSETKSPRPLPSRTTPLQEQSQARAPLDNGIAELCLLPKSDPKRPAACAQLENWQTVPVR